MNQRKKNVWQDFDWWYEVSHDANDTPADAVEGPGSYQPTLPIDAHK